MIIALMLPLHLSSGPNVWLIRLLTTLLAALAAGSSLFWVLHWPTSLGGNMRPVAVAPDVRIDSDKIAMLLGANSNPAGAAPVASVSTQYKLLGVIAQGDAHSQSHRGSALIATEGAPAKPYRVGDEVADGLMLQAVKARSVSLGRAGQTQAAVTLELPLLPGLSSTP
jgi:general secretion pathway protein C